MRYPLVLLVALALAPAGSSATRADLDGKLTCSGTTCTFTVTNTTGKPQLALSMAWTSSATLVKVTDAQARPTTYFDSNNQQKTTAPGECVVFAGGTVGVSCTYAANANEAGWLPNASRTITFALSGAIGKGTKIATCAQPKPLAVSEGCTPQDFAAKTTSRGGPAAGPDLEVVVNGPDVVHPTGAATLRARYTVTVTNRGSAATAGAELSILGAYGAGRAALGTEVSIGNRIQISPACGSPKRRTACRLPRLEPKQSRVCTVRLQPTKADVLSQKGGEHWLRVDAMVRYTAAGDPPGNDGDRQLTHVGR